MAYRGDFYIDLLKHEGVNMRIPKTDEDKYNPISAYLRDIGRIPKLTREENNERFRLMRAAQERGDEKTYFAVKQEVINANLRFVFFIIVKEYPNHIKNSDLFLELISAGNRGLILAAEKFDPDRGDASFVAYAKGGVTQKINQTLMERGKFFLESKSARAVELKKAKKRLQRKFNREPLEEELMDELGITEDQLREMILSSAPKVISLDAPIRDKDGELDGDTFSIFVADSKPLPDENADKNKLKEDLEKALSDLSPLEREVLRLYDLEGLYLWEVADILHAKYPELKRSYKGKEYTRERIRQIRKKALRKLRHPKRSKILFEHYSPSI